MTSRICFAAALTLSCGGAAPRSSAPAAAPAVTAAMLTPPAFRLPGDVVPVRYALDLALDPNAGSFRGEATIDLDVKRPAEVVWLNATDLEIEEAKIGGRAARVVPGGEDYVGFVPEAPLAPGPTRLVIRYQGRIDAVRSRGIYRQPEGDEWYIYTFFEATDARRAFPCFDEPAYKVPWKLTIRAPKGLVVAANTAATGSQEADGKQVVTFAETPPLPSYLVAFVVGPFDVVDGGTAGNFGTPFRILVPRGKGGETGYALKATPKLVGLLEDYFGMQYPFGKLDVAVVPRYWGTMEHPGIVALGQPLTLIKPGEETLQRKQLYAEIGVHELAHYWFGDYVTCAWWNDTWLNEALGTWMDNKMTAAFEPSWRTPLARLIRIQDAMVDDSLASSQKIRLPVESPREIDNAFSSITYTKGNAVMSMFEAYVGAEKFQQGIRRYMKENAWSVATLEDFLAAMGAEVGGEESDAMVTFLDQPGVPMVSAALDCPEGGTPVLHLSQKRYLPAGSKGSPEQTWKIPVCARWPSGRACTLLSDKQGDLALEGAQTCPAWVDANADAHGYYRVRYEGDLRKKLLAAANARRLTPRERIGLTSDVLALISAGEIPAADGLALLPAMGREDDRYVFTGALRLARLIRNDVLAEALVPHRARFFARLLGPRARALGWRARRGESDDVRQLRPMVMQTVGTAGDDARWQREARALALAWLDDRKAVDADMVPAVLAVAAHRGDRSLFDRLVEAIRQSSDRNDRLRLIAALGKFDDPDIAAATLELVRGGMIDLRDATPAVLSLLRGRKTREVTFEWIKANFDAMASRMRDDDVRGTIAGIVGELCDRGHREDAARFFGLRAKQHGGAEKALENALEEVDLCVEGWDRNKKDVEAFLRKY